MNKIFRSIGAVIIAGSFLGTCNQAAAAESGVANYAPGASSTVVGLFPPVPGLFYLNQILILPSGTARGGDGRTIPGRIETSAVVDTSRFVASYGTQIFGASLYSQLVLPVVNLNTTAFRTFKDDDFGLTNVGISPFILDWRLNREQSVVFGFDISTTLGSPIARNTANIKLGYNSFQPILAYRYLKEDGFTFGFSNRFLLNLENSSNKYLSGNAYESDFEVGWLFGKLKLSAAGYYLNQFEDDRQYGRRVPGGNRIRSLAVGPALTYDFGPAIVSLNYQHSILAENTVKQSSIWLSVAVPLYVPPGAPPIPPGSERDMAAKPIAAKSIAANPIAARP